MSDTTAERQPDLDAASVAGRWGQAGARWGKWTFRTVHLGVTIIATLWVLTSVLSVHWGLGPRPAQFTGARIAADGKNPTELRNCNRRLERLLTDLHTEAFSLQARALKFNIDPDVEWRNWASAWRQRWLTLEYYCRFSELRGKGSDPIIDKMAQVHEELGELEVSYSGVMDRFVENYAERLRHLQGSLAASSQAIEAQLVQSKLRHKN